ncbi:p53 and DNA damage-regulated protein 1-like isoform X2 [Haemaphysalis longicornis]
MNPTTAKVKQFLADIESTAETILADKEQAVELDRRRQKNREALRALQKLDDNVRKPWVCIGNMFMKIPKGRTTELLQQEQAKLEEEIASLRKKLKKNVQLLRELEGKSEVQGFSLEPLSREEMQAINKVMGS